MRSLGANVGAIRANDFPRQANGYGQATDDHPSSWTDLDDAERLTGIYESDVRRKDARARKEGHPGRFTVIHGATGTTFDLCAADLPAAATSFASRGSRALSWTGSHILRYGYTSTRESVVPPLSCGALAEDPD